jgi:Tfp pilus assembly protein PilF
MICSSSMTFMHKPKSIIAGLVLLGLVGSGCSSEPQAESLFQLEGSEAFLDRIEEARRHIRFGDLAAAGRSYDEALELDPENAGLWVDIARLRFLGGEHLTAIEAADYALELGPNYAPALLLRAQMVRDANGLEESLPWFEAASVAAPNNAEILGEYAATLGDLGYNRDMLAAVRDLAKFAPDEPQAQYLQAVLAARGEDPALAARLLEKSRYIENGVPAAQMLDAIINMQQGNFDTAANKLEILAEEQPANIRVQELLARAWWLGGRDNLIAERFAQASTGPGASPYITMLVGRALERMGDRNRAIPFIERASQFNNQASFVIEEEASLPQVTNRLRDLLSSRNLSGADSVSSDFLRQFPQSGDAHSLSGDVALASDDALAAIELYQVSAQVRRSWPLTRKLAAAMLQAGEGEAAKVLLARYVQGDPQNLDALIVLARLSAEEADWLRVQVLLDTAIAQGAGSDPAVLTLRARAARELGNEEDVGQAEALLADTLPRPFL